MSIRKILHKDFGKGWMSGNARDMFRMAVYFSDVNPLDLVRIISNIHNGKTVVNAATMCRVFEEYNKEVSSEYGIEAGS